METGDIKIPTAIEMYKATHARIKQIEKEGVSEEKINKLLDRCNAEIHHAKSEGKFYCSVLYDNDEYKCISYNNENPNLKRVIEVLRDLGYDAVLATRDDCSGSCIVISWIIDDAKLSEKSS